MQIMDADKNNRSLEKHVQKKGYGKIILVVIIILALFVIINMIINSRKPEPLRPLNENLDVLVVI